MNKTVTFRLHRKSATKRTGIDKTFRIIGIIIMSLLTLSYVYMYISCTHKLKNL